MFRSVKSLCGLPSRWLVLGLGALQRVISTHLVENSRLPLNCPRTSLLTRTVSRIFGDSFFFFFKSTGYGVNRPVAQHVFNSSHCDLSTSASVPFSKDQRWRNYAGKLREGITSCLYFTQGKPHSREWEVNRVTDKLRQCGDAPNHWQTLKGKKN